MKEIIFNGKKITINNAMYFEQREPVHNHHFIECYVSVPFIAIEIKNKSDECKYIQEIIFTNNTYLINIDGYETEYYISTCERALFYKKLKSDKEKFSILFIGTKVLTEQEK